MVKPFLFLLALICMDMEVDNYTWEISICGPASVSTICKPSIELQSGLFARLVLDISTRVDYPYAL